MQFPTVVELFLIAQAVLIWMIVFASSVPMPKPGKKLAILIVVISTAAAILEILFHDGSFILLTAALAGYGWGSIATDWNYRLIKKREEKILND